MPDQFEMDGEKGLRINAIAPSRVRTDIASGASSQRIGRTCAVDGGRLTARDRLNPVR